jgi:hypothetical protein
MRHTFNQRAFTALFLAIALGCSGGGKKPGPVPPGGSGGDEGGAGGGGGPGGAGPSGGSGGSTGGAGGGSGGAAGAGGSAGGSGGSAGGAGGSTADASAPKADGGGAEAGPSACGGIGQVCCASNTCTAGAPMMGGGPAGTTVLELVASGGNPYMYFASKDLLPIDGPDSGYITDMGTHFQFVLHQNGAEEIVSSGAQRQRNELTVNPGNPAMYKGTKGTTMTYQWRFRLDVMNANPTWCDIFQIKQHGPLGVAPYMAFEANKSELTIDTQKLGVVARTPLSNIMGIWMNAQVSIHYDDAGSLSLSIKKDDGTSVMSYTNNSVDMWDNDVDFVRPKWGLYRNKANGARDATINYNNMKIIRGGTGPSCTCR